MSRDISPLLSDASPFSCRMVVLVTRKFVCSPIVAIRAPTGRRLRRSSVRSLGARSAWGRDRSRPGCQGRSTRAGPDR